MKFKKLAYLLTATALSASFLTACGNNDADVNEDVPQETEANEEAATETPEVNIIAGAELQDGEYSLKEMNGSERGGWRAFVNMTVEGGEITAVEFDYINEDGVLKTEDEDYNERMEDRVGVTMTKAAAQLEEALMNAATISDVEVVTGATRSSNAFINFADQLIQAAQAGNTETIEINNGAELQDGTYRIEEANGSARGGWKAFVEMTVAGGEITDVTFDYKNEEGVLKSEDEDYNERMEDRVGVTITEAVAQLEKALVNAESISDVEVVTGATRSTNNFTRFASQLINAAENGDTTTIQVDNIVIAAE